MSAAQMQLLTARLGARELTALKKLMLRPGFVEEWNSLDSLAAGFAKALLSKANAKPSASFKLFTSYDPEAILWLGFTSKDATVRERFDQFLKVWPEARQRIPHALMQEMRITPELATYREVVHAVFLELIDGRLTTPEELRTFLEPHSPPAPPPQVTIKRPRVKRGAEAKAKERAYDDDEAEDGHEEEPDHDDLVGDDDELDLGLKLPKIELDPDLVEDSESAEIEADDEEVEPVQTQGKRAGKGPKDPKGSKQVPAAPPVAAKVESPVATKAGKPAAAVPRAPASKTVPQGKSAGTVVKIQDSTKGAAPAKALPVAAVKKTAPVPVAPKASKTTVKAPAKAAAKPLLKAAAKGTTKAAVKAAAKPALKSAAKTPAKAPAKSHGKNATKTPGKASGKATKVKPASAKGKPVASSRGGKASHVPKPSRTAAKKPAPKAAKKR
jgi:hypothetical protein